MAITWQTVDMPLVGTNQAPDDAAATQRPRAVRNAKLDAEGALRKRGGFREAADQLGAAGATIGRLAPGPNGGVRADMSDGLVTFADSLGQLLTSTNLAGDGRLVASGLPSPTVPVSRTLEATTGWAHTLDLADFTVVLERSTRDSSTDPPRLTVLTRAGDVLVERLDIRGTVPTGAGASFTAVSNGVTNQIFYASRNIGTGQVSCLVLTVSRAAAGITVTAGTTFPVAVAAAFDVAVGALGTYLLLLSEATGARLYIRSAAGAAVANAPIGSVAGTTHVGVSTKIQSFAAGGRAFVVLGASPSVQTRLLNITDTSIATTGALFSFSRAYFRLAAALVREAGASFDVAGYAILETQTTVAGSLMLAVEWQAVDVSGAAAGGTTLPYSLLHGNSWSPADGRLVTPCWLQETTNPGSAGSTGSTKTVNAVGAGIALVEPATMASFGAANFSPNACTLVGWAALGRAFTVGGTSGNVPFPNPTYSGTFEEPLVLCPTTQYDRRTTVTTTLRAVGLRYPLPGTTSRPPGQPDVGGCALVPDAVPRLSSGPVQVPAGYPHLAEIVRSAQVAGAGAWPSASVSFRARYTWYDSANNELVSAWSLPTQIATPGAVGDIQLDVRLPSFFQGVGARIEFSWAQGGQTSFFQALSSTSAGGTLAASQSADTNIASPTQVLTFFISSAALQQLTPVLVDTASLPNVLPASVTYATQHRDRTLLLSAEGPTLYVSKPAQGGVLPEWPVELALPVPPWVGQAFAVESVGGRIVVLGSQGAAAWSGDAPDALGGGPVLSGPDDLGRGIVCANPRGILATPEGLWFDTAETLCLLTPGGELRPEGRAVRTDLAELPRVFAAAYWRELDARVWLRGDAVGTCELLIRWGSGEWGRWSLPPVDIAALCHAGGQLWAGQGGRLLVYGEGDNGLDDQGGAGATRFPALDYTSAQLQAGAAGDFQACRGLELTVDTRRAGIPVRVRAYFDRSSTAGYDKTLNTPTSGVQQLEFRIEPAERQKCSAVRWQITDAAATSGSAGDGRAGADLLGATVTLGQRSKRGPRRQPPTRRA